MAIQIGSFFGSQNCFGFFFNTGNYPDCKVVRKQSCKIAHCAKIGLHSAFIFQLVLAEDGGITPTDDMGGGSKSVSRQSSPTKKNSRNPSR